MTRQQQIQQPVVGFRPAWQREVEQEALVQRSAADRHLHGELVPLHAPLLGAGGLIALELGGPFTVGVVPEHHAPASQSGVEALVDAGRGGGRQASHQLALKLAG